MTKATPGLEIERRFLVEKITSPETLSGLRKDTIVQGYLGTTPGKTMRVRIKNNEQAILTVKNGSGICRKEYETDAVDLEMGMAALDACTFILQKTRYTFEGWELDIFEGPLKGLVLLERELAHEDEALPPFPAFLRVDREVTESLNNLALAEASTLLTEGADPTQLLSMMSAAPLQMIVITGGPGSGKSTSIGELRDRYPELAFVPEVATLVIAHVGIKPPPHDDTVGMVKFQRLIYSIQRAFEHAAQDQAIREGKKAIILDRGTMDNAAYLEGGVAALSQVLLTTVDAEYARYQGVICLSQPSREIYEQIRGNNAARSEDYDAACALSHRIKGSWGGHPRCLVIGESGTWPEVSAAVDAGIRQLVKTL